ncbi:MAG: guanylate kinase, partial [Dehalococcoidia bacterium]
SKMQERDEFLDCAQVYGRWYGVPRNQVRNGLKSGRDVILKIDVQGAETVRGLIPEAVSIFMLPASLDELRARLVRRMTETSPDTELRLKVAEEELARVSEFDYRVVNRDNCLEQAILDIDAIISAEKCRMKPRMAQLL